MITILILLSVYIKESLPLRMANVSVPNYKVRGQSAILECNYEPDNDVLYSVKWYRDNEEFYRYIPKHETPKRAFRLEGIKVDLTKSDDRRVYLHQVTLKSSGVYRCEVSAEKPSFASAAAEGRLEVIYLPREGPRITGNELEEDKRNLLFLNCTSGKSYPAATLSWDIDGEKVLDETMLISYPPIQHAHGLMSSRLGLKVPVSRSMQVRCTATVTPEWMEGSEAVIEEKYITDSKEAMLLVRNSCCPSPSGSISIIISLLYFFTDYMVFVT